MFIIGLDPSLRGFGWVVLQCDEDGSNTDIVDMGVWKTDAKTLYVKRYTYLREQLRSLIRRFPDTAMLGMEIPPLNESYSAGLYALHVMNMEAVTDFRQRCVHLNPSTVKSMASEILGYKGKIDKTEIVKAAKILYPSLADSKRLNHNVADALILAHMTKRFHLFQKGIITSDDLTPKESDSYYGWRPRLKEVQGLISKEDDQWYAFDEPKFDTLLGSKPQRSSGSPLDVESSPAPVEKKASRSRKKNGDQNVKAQSSTGTSSEEVEDC